MSTAAARGPLQFLLGNAGGQWLVLGAGTVAMFPEKVDQLLGTSFRKSLAALSAPGASASETAVAAPQPIVIHAGGSSSEKEAGGTVVTTIVTYSVGAGTIWVAYMVATNMLPDWAKDMLPVSRKFFDKAITSLGKGILQVREVLGKQIFAVEEKQDELSRKQDETHRDVNLIQSELADARGDLAELSEALSRCEGQLDSAEQLQIYTSRGVKLLVRCVAGVLPQNDRIMNELLQFTKEGEIINRKMGSSNNNGSSSHEAPSPAQQEIFKLTTEAKPQQPPTILEESPENEHHPVPVATPLTKQTSRGSSMGSLESVSGVEEVMALLREGKLAVKA